MPRAKKQTPTKKEKTQKSTKKKKSDNLQITKVDKAYTLQNQNFRNRKASSGTGGSGITGSDSLSLNKFIEKGSQIFDVHTGYSVNKQTGKKFGKHLLFTDTTNEMHQVIDRDCKYDKSYDSKQKCGIDKLNEDYPEFCMFGKTCIKKAVAKLIDKKSEAAEIDDISDDDLEAFYGIKLDSSSIEDEIF